MNSVKSKDTKINVQKCIAFIYTHNEAAESEIKNTISFIIAPNILRYQGINLKRETIRH